MKRCAPFLLILLLTLASLGCVIEESTNTTPVRPLLSSNTNNNSPQVKSSPRPGNANSKLNNARPSASPTPTSTTTARNLSNSAEQRTGGSGDDYYINSKGVRVRRPIRSSTVPAGATARCRDGTYSFSQSRRGTCSHHGGVAEWL